MSRFKDEWNERYYNAYEEARECGHSEETAKMAGERAGADFIEGMFDEADIERKRRKEQ